MFNQREIGTGLHKSNFSSREEPLKPILSLLATVDWMIRLYILIPQKSVNEYYLSLENRIICVGIVSQCCWNEYNILD